MSETNNETKRKSTGAKRGVYSEDFPEIRINFQALLNDHGMSQREFARKYPGLSLDTIQKLANGKIKRIPVELLYAIHREFNVGIGDILNVPVRR